LKELNTSLFNGQYHPQKNKVIILIDCRKLKLYGRELSFIEAYTCEFLSNLTLSRQYTKTLCCKNLRLIANQDSQEAEEDLL